MKLATFRVDTPIGAFDRFGIVRLDGGAKDIVSSARARPTRASGPTRFVRPT
jgi:hypothetical protein